MDMMKGDAQCVAMETLGDQTHPELNPSPEDPLCGTVIDETQMKHIYAIIHRTSPVCNLAQCYLHPNSG